jgi:hypothetical protein
LAALAEGATISEACIMARVGRRTAYDRRQRDGEFAVAWADAVERSTELLEDHARARALAGPEDPGAAQLLMFLLKARRPGVYRERVDLRHSGRVERSGDLAGVRRAAARDPHAAERMAAALAAAERGQAVTALVTG